MDPSFWDGRMPLVSESPPLLHELIDADAGADGWAHITHTLNRHGSAVLSQLLSQQECETVAGLYADAKRFRSRVVMQRHGFGQGEYQYFSYPLPDIVAQLRTVLYPRLVQVANAWNGA